MLPQSPLSFAMLKRDEDGMVGDNNYALIPSSS